MWSLYKKKGEEIEGEEISGDKLEPLQFSNGKTQADVVKEILKGIEEGNKIIFVKGVCGTGKCLEKDSLVFCKPKDDLFFSYYKISELVGKEGEIMSLDEKGGLVKSYFKNVRSTGIKKLFKLITRSGREIVASDNHPFLTINKDGILWSPLSELNDKSYICLPNKIDLTNSSSELRDSELKILGHLISEGKLGDKAGSPKYYQDKDLTPLIREDYINSLKDIFPDGEIRDKHQTEVKIVFNNMNTAHGTTNKLRLFVRRFGLDGTNSGGKFVPKEIFNLPENKIAIFLQALFSGDGCIYCKKSKNKDDTIIVEYDTISKRLMQDVSLLLTRFGIQHTINKHSFRGNKEYSWRLCVSSQAQVGKFVEKIGFLGEKQIMALELLKKCKNHKFTNIDKIPRIIREYLKNKGYSYNALNLFVNSDEVKKISSEKGYKDIIKDKTIKFQHVFRQSNIDFLRSHLRKVNEHVKDDVISFVCNEQIVWDKVKSIEFLKEDVAYDLEVEKYHNFIANGIIVHNSAIALNLAKHFKKTSIVVPIKNLQDQYEKDYTNKNFILKEDKKQLKISVIKGRNNFRCPYSGERADDLELPCTIEIREKNFNRIKEFIEQNKEVSKSDFSSIDDVRRMSIAPVCPFWSPLMPAESKSLSGANKKKYEAVSGKEFAIFQRRKGCPYYDQYQNYVDADVLIFNSQKYIVETLIGRKPKTDLDVIDECDEFLDSLAQEKRISLNRFVSALSNLKSVDQDQRSIIKEMIFLANSIIFDVKPNEIEKINNTELIKLVEKILKNPYLAEDEEDSYYNRVFEICREYGDFLDETYVSFSKQEKKEVQEGLFAKYAKKEDENVFVTLVTINLAKRFQDLLDSTKALVLMSGTLHSAQVLKDIFGLTNFKIIEAETQSPGTIVKYRTGLEKNCKFENFKNGLVTRSSYLKALSCCVANAKPPTLVHVNSFEDLPTEMEIAQLGLDNLISKERLQDMQNKGGDVESFKTKQTDILFSTRCSRGVDFPGDQCNSIIITKYPYPNIQSLFWKILRKEQPEKNMEFYMDKARRELLQKVFRGVRFKGDHVILLSPDSRVLDANLS